MTEFPKDILFKYSWRKYQQRVLNELEKHLKDNHLHIIAPPGSGKTVLGIEVALRLNHPTLILAPTLAIRNQWIQRFCELFLQCDQLPDWISKDIRNPKFMTVVTYQRLHAACNNLRTENLYDETNTKKSNDLNLDTIVNKLKEQNIKTIVADEAHHLKNEWWQTLTKVKEKLTPVIVGLTATPPYDVSANEWERYSKLNGPVDTEISVPELVAEGDLCPHQDYVYFSVPTEQEHESIVHFRKNIETLFQEIKQDEILTEALENYPVWVNPIEHLDWIYTNISSYSSILIFLKEKGREIPKIHFEIIGTEEIEIPNLEYEWIEILLDFYIYKEKEYFSQDHKDTIEGKLRRYGAVEKQKINFFHNKNISRYLNSSISKLNAIKEIVDFEYNQLGKELRLVILTDYIRKEFYINASENNLELNKIGILSIFEKLRRENTAKIKIGVLTGSVIIIPKTAFAILTAKAKQQGIITISHSVVPFDINYILIHQTDPVKHHIVHLITEIFQQGEIEVLIGTKSLLGEGWDAPAINSLILASFVGSFVLSNQMRGRAIRTQNGNTSKTSTIWHLASIDETLSNGGNDLEIIKRRFKSFVGISVKEENGIENGLDRLNVLDSVFDREEIEKTNKNTFLYATDRSSLLPKWEKAIKEGIHLIEEIKIPFAHPEKEYQKEKKLYHNKTIAYATIETVLGLLLFYSEIMFKSLGRLLQFAKTPKGFFQWVSIIGITGMLYFGKKLYTSFNLYIKYRDISKDLQKIGNVLLHTLIKVNYIRTLPSLLKVSASVNSKGAIYCHLEGGTTFEKSVFINALQEIIEPIENPRYIIIRKSRFLFFIKQKDYHAVPELLGKNKKTADYFKEQWQQTVGNCELIFTRTLEGRKLILQSRMKSLSSQFDNHTERINKWR